MKTNSLIGISALNLIVLGFLAHNTLVTNQYEILPIYWSSMTPSPYTILGVFIVANVITLYCSLFPIASTAGNIFYFILKIATIPLTGAIQFLMYRILYLETNFKDEVNISSFFKIHRIWNLEEKCVYAYAHFKLQGLEIEKAIPNKSEIPVTVRKIVSPCNSISEVVSACNEYQLNLIEESKKKGRGSGLEWYWKKFV